MKNNSIISSKQKNSIISKYLELAEGPAKLAASMVNPMKLRIEYSSIARVLEQKKSKIKTKYSVSKIKEQEYEIPLNKEDGPRIGEYFDRMQDIVKHNIVEFENSEFLSLIDSMGLKSVKVKASDLNQKFFDNLYKKFKYTNIVMNTFGFAIVRKQLALEDAGCVQKVLRGILAEINSGKVNVGRQVAKNKIYLFSKNSKNIQPPSIEICTGGVYNTYKKGVHGKAINFMFIDKMSLSLNPKAIKIIEIL